MPCSCINLKVALVDLIPIAVSNALNIRIFIIYNSTRRIMEGTDIFPYQLSDKIKSTLPYIILHFNNEHYSGTQHVAASQRTLTPSPSPCIPPSAQCCVTTSSLSAQCCVTTSSLSAQCCVTTSLPSAQCCVTTSSPSTQCCVNTSTASTSIASSLFITPPCMSTQNKPELLTDDLSINDKELSIVYYNIQDYLSSYDKSACDDSGSHSKIDMLRYILRNQPPTVLSLSETKLSRKISDSELYIPGFDLFRKDRTRKGGGVAIYCNTNFRPSVVMLPDNIFSTRIEVLVLKVSPPNYNAFMVCAIYRPPSLKVAWIRDFYALLNWLSLQKVHSVILGDLNEDLLTNPDFATNIALSFNMKQHIIEPTRITVHSKTLIDHIYTTDATTLSCSGVYELHLSDHRAVYCFINSLSRISSRLPEPPRTTEYRMFDKINIDQLTHDLTAAPWSVAMAFDNIDDQLDSFMKLFNDVWNIHAPIIKRRVRKQATPWMTPKVLQAIHKRDHAYRNSLKSPSDGNRIKYKSLHNKATSAIRNAKRVFFTEGARKGTKQFWRNIKLCTGFGKAKVFRTPWPCSNKQSSTCSANMVNKHFIDSISSIINSISTKRTCSLDQVDASDQTKDDNAFLVRKISSADVEVAIASLSDTASTGMDNISSKMLKLSRKTISGVLAEIFNNSITMSSFPVQWKQAVVIPIFKKGDVTDVNNYRLISLLPVLSKVFEKIIAAQFCQHIENSCILSPSQFGFRLGRSTESALLRLSKLLFTARQNGRFTSLTTIDFSKAFDCICHSRLLNKLSHYKISHESILSLNHTYWTAANV